jgi:ATP-dependent RNA helicase SUPV3L1/SUV3
MGKDCAVIYGSLPPGTKLAMSERFNDPKHPCKIMVATDAIGMGLNLNIRRIIFYSLNKIHLLEDGNREMKVISVSQALQIAGRAGRFGTQWETGYVTCFSQEDIATMHELLAKSPPDILQCGLHPTFDQIEMYAYHLPQASLANLIDIFASLSVIDDSLYSLCQMEDFKFLADMIEHIKLPLKAKYTFCCAPINRKMPLVCTMFMKIVRQYSRGELLTFDWLCHQIGWPFSPPDTILDLVHLEAVHDVFDLYLWLSYRFPDMFPDVELVRSVQNELDEVIQDGIVNIVQLLRNSDSGASSSVAKVREDDAFEAKTRKTRSFKDWEAETKGKKGKGKSLTDRLVSDGLLTDKMVKDLHREFAKERKKSGKQKLIDDRE